MGRAICKSLVSAGAVVCALDKNQQTLDSLVSEVLSLAVCVCMTVLLSVCLSVCGTALIIAAGICPRSL